MADEQQYLGGNTRRGGAGRSCSMHEDETSGHCSNSSSSSPNLLGLGGGSSGSGPKLVYHTSSAPMAIPDWQKIYGAAHETPQPNTEDIFKTGQSYADEDGDDDGEMIPPHEYIAKKLASCQISSFSVCEGAGRTLKGRDLSRVRNAILTKTGFLE